MKNLSHVVLASLITFSGTTIQAKSEIEPISIEACNSVKGKITQLGGCIISASSEPIVSRKEAIVFPTWSNSCRVRDRESKDIIFTVNSSCNRFLQGLAWIRSKNN